MAPGSTPDFPDSLAGGAPDFSATIWPMGSSRALKLPTADEIAMPDFPTPPPASVAATLRPPGAAPQPERRSAPSSMDTPMLTPRMSERSWASPSVPHGPPPDDFVESGKGYELGALVGQGGQGEVYEARQESLGRVVAVKTIRSDSWDESGIDPRLRSLLRREFMQESLIAARLEHPNIVPVHDLGFAEGGKPLLAMKMLRGQSWASLISRDMPAMGETEFLAKHLPILLDMAQAVAFAHSRGIMHRDLKPSQVIVGDYGETVLMDWGLALQFSPLEERISWSRTPVQIPTVETAQNPAGTPALMAPEQTDPTAERLGPHTDIYLLGGTLYLLLTGAFPHQGNSVKDVVRAAASGWVSPPHERAPDRWIPEELARLAMVCLAAEPGHRLATVELFIDGLRAYLTGANRQAESQALVAEAQQLMDQRRPGESAQDSYRRHAKVAERLTRALELWPQNRFARELRAENLAARLLTETDSGDLLLAQTHLEELKALAEANPDLRVDLKRLETEVQRAATRRDRQHRQRVRFAWAAGLLLAGHGLGMTYSFLSARVFANNLEEQYERTEQLLVQARDLTARTISWEKAPPTDPERLEVLQQIGQLLTTGGDPRGAMPYLQEALDIARRIAGPDSALAQQAASALEAARQASLKTAGPGGSE